MVFEGYDGRNHRLGIDQKVKQLIEEWTYDGSNVKLDKAFRIYTNSILFNI